MFIAIDIEPTKPSDRLILELIFFFFIVFSVRLIPESLQWLLLKAKYDLVEKSFKSIMQTNDKSFDEDLLEMQVKVYIVLQIFVLF